MKSKAKSTSELPVEGVRYVLNDDSVEATVPPAASAATRRSASPELLLPGDVDAVVPSEDGLSQLAVDPSGFELSKGGLDDAAAHFAARESKRGH